MVLKHVLKYLKFTSLFNFKPDDHFVKIKEERRNLPIHAARNKLIGQIQQHDSVVIIGETGSGKTTQIPQYLYESGIHRNCIIAITQVKQLRDINKNMC